MANPTHSETVKGASREEAVAYWDTVLRSADCDADDRDAFNLWLESDEENAKTFYRAQSLIEGLTSIRKNPEIQSMREAALAQTSNIVPVTRYRIFKTNTGKAAAFGAIAASLALFIGFQSYNSFEEGALSSAPQKVVADSSSENLEFKMGYGTSIGGRSTVTLNDGSQATLNTDTQIEVDYRKGQRLVTVLNGEAFFDVKKAPDRPFIVKAANRTVKAIGTSFSVTYIDDKFEVSLLEGKVEVVENQNLPTQKTIQMEAGQKFVAILNKAGAVSEQEKGIKGVAQDILWRQDRVFFDGDSLQEAVTEMNRYSANQIYIRGTDVSDLRINGTFRAGEQDVFVEALQAYFNIKVQKNKSGYIITK